MVMVDIEKDIYKETTEIVKKRRLHHPSIRNYVNKAIDEKNTTEKERLKE